VHGYRGGVGIRVVLADDNLLIREGLERVLAAQAGIEVVATCSDLPSLQAAIDRDQPDVVLTDIRMPPSNLDEGIQVATRLRDTDPSVGVVVLSQYAEPSYALALLDGSAGRGYLLKERVHDGAQLRSSIETVAAGGSVIDPKVVELLVSSSRHANARSSPRSPRARATPRSESRSCSRSGRSRSTSTRSF
jgi:DNA-binding NarL/FixJ family response regulator